MATLTSKSLKKAEKFYREFCATQMPLVEIPLEQELSEIQALLQNAMLLEHATIPAYLTMLYSLNDDVSWQSLEVVRSVVVEEMLHMTLGGNVLNAIGGHPQINDKSFMPSYPSALPYGIDGITVSLLPFSREAVLQGMAIEHPRIIDPKVVLAGELGEMNIGEFYHYIQIRLCNAVRTFGEKAVFNGDPALQIPAKAYYYEGTGGVIEVVDLMSALRALQMIADQGEGAQGGIWSGKDSARESGFREVAHFFRFNEVLEGRQYREGDTVETGPTGAVFDVPWDQAVAIIPNVKLNDYPKGAARDAVYAFNVRYCETLAILQEAFSGQPDLLIEGVVAMCSLRDDFRRILANPFPGKPGLFCSPTFEFVETSYEAQPTAPAPAAACPHASAARPLTSNAETLKRLNQAFATGNLTLALSCLSTDLVWDISGPPSVPYAGVFYGHDGYSRFWALLSDTIQFASAGVSETFFGDTEAMAYGGEQGFVKSNNAPYHYDWAILYRFDANHRITMMRQFYDPARIDAALQAKTFPTAR